MQRAPVLLIAVLLFTLPRSQALAQAKPGAGQPPIDLRMGGTGGVYFLAEPGELIVDVEKRDRNRRAGRYELRAILAGPDRAVLQDVTIPDDGLPPEGKLGKAQRVRLSTHVDRKGVYALNVTVSRDRYGDEILWGFWTNCPKYLIEMGRGHRDERHQEPIVLQNPDRPGEVCFLPRSGELSMEVTGLPKGLESLAVYDGHGKLIEKLPVDARRQASHTFPAKIHREAVPWRLHLPVQQAVINIDGVTRWDREDLCPDVCSWSPDPKSFFPWLKYRWLLTPYSRTIYGKPGDQGQIAFRVHNNADQPITVQLKLEFPEDPWPARLSAERIVLGAKEAGHVSVAYAMPTADKVRVCHLRATPAEDPAFSTYSTLTLKAGEPPCARPLAMPLVLKPCCHENEQFGYLPDLPLEYQPYFDLKNRPWMCMERGVQTWRDGQWREGNMAEKRGQAPFAGTAPGVPRTNGASPLFPAGWPRSVGMKIAFDRQGDAYLLAGSSRQASLLHSADGGKTFAAYPIPARDDGSQVVDIEQFSGHNVPDGPPPLVRFTQTAADPRLIWRRINDVELFLPAKMDGRIELGKPVLLTRRAIGLSLHSGIVSSVVSRGTKVHVTWGEATEPGRKIPGVPTYVVTYDRATGKLGEPALVGHGPPPNDVHNSPSITMDSQGYLHVLAGTHGQPFPYAQSLKPNTAQEGWTDAVPVGEGLRQTYIGLVCGPDDTLHMACRLWRQGEEPFPASHYATLAYHQKPRGKPWQAPQVLIVPPFSEYSVFRHRLTIDRIGRLFLRYEYWSTYWFYRMDEPGARLGLLMSPDGGKTWKLPMTRDLLGE